MTRFLHVCAFLLVASATAQNATVPAARVRIGTWNLEFFGNRKDNPRTDDDVRKVAEFIRTTLAVDVLAVQEVGTLEALQQLTQLMGPSWRLVLGTTGMWRDGSGGQRVGFVWNDQRVELLQAEELLALPREAEDPQTGKLPIFHRIPVSAVFRARNGGIDFRAITVHLKADNKNDIDRHMRDEMSTRKRVAEMAALGAEVKRLFQRNDEDRDLVVLGDFNHVFVRERSTETPTEGKVRFDLRVPLLTEWPDFARLAPSKPSPTIRWFPESIDHVVVSSNLQQEAIVASLAVHGPFTSGEPTDAELNAWQKTFSDHFPVTIDLDARQDNDQGASFAPVVPAHELRAGGWAAASQTPAAPAPTRTPQRAPAPTSAPIPPPVEMSAAEATSVRLRIGQQVQVTLVNGQTYDGHLVTTLNVDWIQIDLHAGNVMAFPTHNVLSVLAK